MPACLQVRIDGSRDSPWLLPFTVNLALAAAAEGEGGLIIVPERLMPAAARLLGAAAGQLGPCFEESVSVRALEPYPGICLGPPYLMPLLSRRRDLFWLFALKPTGGQGSWLYLQSDPADPFTDPRTPPAVPLFLIGLDHQPEPRSGVTGIWGSLPVSRLLDPDRPSWPSLVNGAESARRQYRGYLQALRHMGAFRAPVSRREGGS